jgi:hypothetical protein
MSGGDRRGAVTIEVEGGGEGELTRVAGTDA